MNKKDILFYILVTAALLRLVNLSVGDTISDEVFMSFRGIGMIDFDEAAQQITPWEWQDPDIKWWAKLSFHDHPLLVPYIQHISMAMFGENNFAFRLPSAILGTASVYLLYLIGTLLYSENASLLSAAFLGLTLNHVYISRTGMQEAYVIFFILLGFYIFLKSLRNEKYLPWVGAVIGLAAETKYTSLILVPIFLTYLLIFKRNYFKNKYLWYGILLFFLIFSPTIIYNTMLYRETGHFDFQFSHIFGQRPEVWKVAPGKEIGTLGDRIRNFIPRMIASNSWLFLSTTAFSLIAFLWLLFKNPRETLNKNSFLLIVFSFLLLLLLLIGPSYRFLTMLTPFLTLAIGLMLIKIWDLHYFGNKFALLIIALIFLFEIFYSINNQILAYPIGPEPWLASKVRYENYNWGYNELGEFLEKELSGKMPALSFDLQYKFLEDLRDQALEKGQRGGLEPYPALFVYSGNFDMAAKLWILDRLQIYHAWPIISLKTYYDYLQERGFDYYDRAGFKNYYFILQTNTVPSEADQALMRGVPISIYNKRGEEIFKIYKYTNL
ncbi:MAG: glycosyltransferase family 39 protein [Candidatus Harrisonbacteria bacterium]|nr:glycosyltransferase family 39 protein [Candidatus Harrisonbacteria bacterium]